MDIYFSRQLFILSNFMLNSFSSGIMLAYPSVLSPAITSSNGTDITTTSDHASWITAVNGLGGLLGSIILPLLLQMTGRRICNGVKELSLLIGFLIFPFAKNIADLYAARFIQGIGSGGIYVQLIILSEYCDPCRRGYFMTLNKVAIACGVLSCHMLSISWTWRQIAVLASAFPFIGIITNFFWPESPSYLALKGQFAACEKSFEWLHGDSEESRKQMKSLIDVQRKKIVVNDLKTNSFKKLIKSFLQKDFQKPIFITTALTVSLDVGGRYFYMAYIIQIMNELLNSSTSAMFFTLGADLLTLIAISASSVIIRLFNRRTIIFTSGTLSAMLMLLISLMSYLKSIYVFPIYGLWLIAIMVILQSFISNIGMVPVAFTIIGEIFPLEHKGLGSFTSCLIFTLLYGTVMKVIPVLMENTNLYGTYGIFGVVLSVCLLILYIIVPETKDKTLQQIEDELNTVSK